MKQAGSADDTLALTFETTAIEWRGPAPFVFATLPASLVPQVREAARAVSYGWGCVPVEAVANGIAFRTSLFPRDGGYLVPLKLAVRRGGAIAVGDAVALELRLTTRR